ncbi:hypothetical protein [Rhizobium sp.]|uniref:hypothetical protein n=1 Tax=Rhizobium sp. TaxID=391 RepID=UPI0028AF4B81
MSDPRIQKLVDECHRQEENCRYTAVSFTLWLRWLKRFRLFCEVAPIVFGALATWKIVSQTSPTWAAVFTLLATVIPPVYKASKADRAIDDYTTATGEFTNLRDRFRQVATISSHEDFSQFEAKVKPLLDRLEKVRARALTPPEWLFKLSQRKVQSGDYTHDYDLAKQAADQG